MPTYEYRCPRGHEFEVFQRISDEPGATCPECGEAAERMISAGAGFLFKGEGFYITDYRSKEYKEKSSAEKDRGSSADPSKAADASGTKSKEAPKDTSKSSDS
jgi:putative FmdB family regulatory protein